VGNTTTVGSTSYGPVAVWVEGYVAGCRNHRNSQEPSRSDNVAAYPDPSLERVDAMQAYAEQIRADNIIVARQIMADRVDVCALLNAADPSICLTCSRPDKTPLTSAVSNDRTRR
jgi:hypothetical protein